MADNDKPGIIALTVPAMATFLNIYEAKAVGGKGTPKFSTNFEFPPDHPDLPALKAAMASVARAKWPSRELGGLKFPLTDGTKLADRAKEKGKDREFSRGLVVLAARSKFPPRLSAVVNGKLIEYTDETRATSKDKFYSGVNVLAQFNFEAYDGVDPNPDGVTAYLNMICSLGTGDRVMGAGASAADVFKGYVGSMSTVDPTGGLGLGDEIAF